MKKVILPTWWAETKKTVVGYTDGKTTYCCSAEPTWFVDVPEFEYSGYFNVSDLKVVKKRKG